MYVYTYIYKNIIIVNFVFISQHLREDTHKKKVVFLVVGPLRI